MARSAWPVCDPHRPADRDGSHGHGGAGGAELLGADDTACGLGANEPAPAPEQPLVDRQPACFQGERHAQQRGAGDQRNAAGTAARRCRQTPESRPG
jgi:hypothetical protein